MKRARRLRWLTLALVLVVAAGACSSAEPDTNGDPSATTGAPAAAAAPDTYGPFTVAGAVTLSAGDPIGEDLAVAEGSNILGGPFPDGDGGGGFLALGLVLDDPVLVFNDYVGQAQRQGMTESDQGGCLPSATALVCLRRLADPADGETLSIRVERRPAGAAWVSHVALRYQPPGTTEPGEVGTEAAAPPTAPLTPPTLPGTVAPPDDAAWNASVAPFGPALSLVPDSELVGPPGPCGCAATGWSAVLRITGDPEAVLAAYAAQVSSDPITLDAQEVGERRVVTADLGLAAGGFVQLRLVVSGADALLMVAVAIP